MLYQIIGSGRSGSTIFEAYLGQHIGATQLGELMYIWDRGFLKNWKCACGSPFRDCQFWVTILQQVGMDNLTNRDVVHFLDMRKKVASYRSLAKRVYFADFEKKYAKDIQTLREAYLQIYSAVKNLTGNQIIIDSSKEPGHAALFKQDKDIKCFHLIRHPAGVANSWLKTKANLANGSKLPFQGLISSSLEWASLNKLIMLAGKQDIFPNYEIIIYENFCDQPNEIVENITSQKNEGKQQINFGHSISGNPIRFAKYKEISKDTSWEDNLSSSQKFFVKLICNHVWRQACIK